MLRNSKMRLQFDFESLSTVESVLVSVLPFASCVNVIEGHPPNQGGRRWRFLFAPAVGCVNPFLLVERALTRRR